MSVKIPDLQRRHFNYLADLINRNRGGTVQNFARNLSNDLRYTNAQFSPTRFLTACGVSPEDSPSPEEPMTAINFCQCKCGCSELARYVHINEVRGFCEECVSNLWITPYMSTCG